MSNELVPLSDLEKMAATIAKSKLFGMTEPSQIMALMLVAQAEGLHPMAAIQQFHIIQGQPARKAWSMLERFQKAGGSVQWHERTDAKVSATFTHPQGGSAKVDWDHARAVKAGIKNANYQKYPRQMLTARVISEGVRTVFPGSTGGFYEPGEVEDMQDVTPKRGEATHEKQEVIDATTGEVTTVVGPKSFYKGKPIAEANKAEDVPQEGDDIFPPSDNIAPSQPVLQDKPDPAKARLEAIASRDHCIQRIKSFTTAAELDKWTARYKATINAMPEDLAAEVWNAATDRIEALSTQA